MPTLTVIAGPNGSGKTTLTDGLRRKGLLDGEYINADDIALGLTGDAAHKSLEAQTVAEARRQRCIAERRSFAFETVMSHPSKIDLMRQAARAGYKITLYFVGTSDPEINLARVRQRVLLGGHDVPADRIVARYYRTMDLMLDAIEIADASYIFDNSRVYASNRPGFRLILHCIRRTKDVIIYHAPPPWVANRLGSLIEAAKSAARLHKNGLRTSR